MLERFPLLKEVEALLEGVTEEDLKRAEYAMSPAPPGTQTFGPIREEVRRVWALSLRLSYLGLKDRLANVFQEADPALAEINRHNSVLIVLTNKLAWSLILDDLKIPAAEETRIYSGWVVANPKEKPTLASLIEEIFAGKRETNA